MNFYTIINRETKEKKTVLGYTMKAAMTDAGISPKDYSKWYCNKHRKVWSR